MNDLQKLINDVDQMVRSFDKDPADSDYQKGYLAALIEVRKMAVSKKG